MSASDVTLKIVSWNIHQRDEPWRALLDTGADVALLQEASQPPVDVADRVRLDPKTSWKTAGSRRPWCATVAGLSDRVDLTFEPPVVSLGDPGGLGVSRNGTLAVARATVRATGETFTLASMYACWERPLSAEQGGWIFADASVHRLISDLAPLIATQTGHKIIAAGDLNSLRGYGENGSPYWARRYNSIFARMEAMGLPFAGPELPDGGLPPADRPSELPADSLTVPSFRRKMDDHATATRQLDFAFASQGLLSRLRVVAWNSLAEWGPSDHCRVFIDVLGQEHA